jgi:hypothetical protein
MIKINGFVFPIIFYVMCKRTLYHFILIHLP